MTVTHEEQKQQLLTLLYRLEKLEKAYGIPGEVRLPSMETDNERDMVTLVIKQRVAVLESRRGEARSCSQR